jgi:hypothetical protein
MDGDLEKLFDNTGNNINESVETEVEGVSAIKEDGQAVGAMLPVTAPDEVYEKNILTTEAVDNEYDSLKLKKEEKEKATNQQLDSSKSESKPDAAPKNEASPLAKEYKENAEEIEQLMKECGMKTSYEPVFEEGNEAAIFEDGDEAFTEGGDRHIDDDIKPMIDKLNEKGYKTMASCSGHPSSRSKSDRYRDGVKYGKLYSTARVVFDKIYDFPNVPDGWSKKVMKDDNRVGIYVDPPSFKIINGLPEKQYTNWKRRYMAALEKWVNDLPKEGETKEDDNSDIALESVLNDLTTDALVGQGYGESYTD